MLGPIQEPTAGHGGVKAAEVGSPPNLAGEGGATAAHAPSITPACSKKRQSIAEVEFGSLRGWLKKNNSPTEFPRSCAPDWGLWQLASHPPSLTTISSSLSFSMARLAPTLLLAAISAAAVAAQAAPPLTTNNAQSACVQFGSCSTAGGNGVVTETQNSPVTQPAGTPALATYTTLDSAYISSLAAAGASSAYAALGGNGGASSAVPRTATTSARGRATSTAAGSAASSSGSMGLGSLGSSNAAVAMSANSAALQMLALAAAAVLGAAMLL